MPEMTIESYQEIYSDFHKDACGFRPRHDTSHWTLDDWKREFESLERQAKMNQKREAEMEADALAELERDINKLIQMGAADRATAIRWILGDEKDPDYVCDERGLPYGTLNL